MPSNWGSETITPSPCLPVQSKEQKLYPGLSTVLCSAHCVLGESRTNPGSCVVPLVWEGHLESQLSMCKGPVWIHVATSPLLLTKCLAVAGSPTHNGFFLSSLEIPQEATVST